MQPDIILSTNGLIALGVFGGAFFVLLPVALFVATIQNEKLERRLAEANEQVEAARTEKEPHGLLSEGAFRLMNLLKKGARAWSQSPSTGGLTTSSSPSPCS